MRTTAKRLIRRRFDGETPHNSVNSFALQHKHAKVYGKDFTGELFDPQYLISRGRSSSVIKRRSQMAWKAPKIVEVSVGMEINMYMCATRK
jgi:coenzyme PQQ precursor peptide PqqA